MDPTTELMGFMERFSLKKLLVLLLVLSIAIICFFGFEAYTSHFRHQRAERQIELLERLSKIRAEQTLTKEEDAIRARILLALAEEQESFSLLGPPRSTPYSYSFSFAKFGFGALPMFLLWLPWIIIPHGGPRKQFIAHAIWMPSLMGALATLSPFDGMLMVSVVTPLAVTVIGFVVMLLIGWTIEWLR
jgi:hypothetical protein